MLSSNIALTNGLTFLAYVTGIIFVIISVFLIKLLIDLSKLTKNADTTLDMVKSELEPTLQEIKTSLKSINTFVKTTNDNVDTFKNKLSNSFKLGSSTLLGLKSMSGSLITGALKGFTTVVKLFSK